MERNQAPVPQKSSSFSPATTREEKLREADRNLSLGAIKLEEYEKKDRRSFAKEQIKEECEDDDDKAGEETAGDDGGAYADAGVRVEENEPDLVALSEDVDVFLAGQATDVPTEIPEATVEKFAAAVEKEIARSEAADDKWATDAGNGGEQPPLLAAVTRTAALAAALTKNAAAMSEKKYSHGVHRVTGVLHRAMAFLEDEFHALLEDPRVVKAAAAGAADPGSTSGKMKRPPSFEHKQEPDRCVLPSSTDTNAGESSPPYPPETVERLHHIADAMITAGYVTESTQVFLVARRNAFDAALSSLGYEKTSIDDVVRMAWEPLEGEIATWIKAFRHAINVGFSTEHDLCTRVFAGHPAIGRGMFADLVRCVMLHMLNFTEAVAMTKRAAEKLFKVLDMYEAIRDSTPVVEALLTAGGKEPPEQNTALTELKAEITSVRSRLGESAAAIFCDLEGSIRADAAKQPVPGGAVHPLTRYVMNYLKYACEYKKTLEQVFKEHHKPGGYLNVDNADATSGNANNTGNNDSNTRGDATTGAGANSNSCNSNSNAFAAQLMEVMDLLHGNLEAKSKLYKDPALSNIFMMNNGRYMLQKIRGSAEINALLGDAWGRKRSTHLRQYHKNYQRETWGRVLGCLRDDGLLTVKGSVQKPVLKERLKAFNAAFEEIHRTQSAWVVSDEQLQSELRVSISAVVVPAYRSFLGRFAQHLNPGRQTEKYVKFGAEDLEGYIDELFDGNPTSMARRRT